MESLIGVLIGGLISIVTTLTIDARRAKRELRHRWDADGLEAIASYVDAVNRAIGALYDEGRSRSEDGAGSERLEQFDRAARSAMDTTRVAHARARLVMNRMHVCLANYQHALGDLKTLADVGFAADDPRWKAVQSQLAARLDELLAEAANTLKIQPE